MIFALAHATLGWAFAFLAALILRRRPAASRCWAWRLGLLKGPVALLLAVPVAVAPPTLIRNLPLSEERQETYAAAMAPSPRAVASSPAVAAPLPDSRGPLPSLSLLYGAGVAAVLLARLAAARRVHRGMPRVEGVLRPRVVLPGDLDPQSAAMALAHERAHVRRRDPQWSLAADLVCAALWFAPPVWLCARAMRAEAEAACDEAALRETGASPRAYARLLLSFAGPAPANALGGPARRLARRVVMLQKTCKPIPRPLLSGLLAVGLVALLPWQAVAQTPPKPEPAPSAPKREIQNPTPKTSTSEEHAMRARIASLQAKVRALETQLQSMHAHRDAAERLDQRRHVDHERNGFKRRLNPKSLSDLDTMRQQVRQAMVEARRSAMRAERLAKEAEARAQRDATRARAKGTLPTPLGKRSTTLQHGGKQSAELRVWPPEGRRAIPGPIRIPSSPASEPVRRALRLFESLNLERLQFRPDQDYPGSEVADFTDKDGSVRHWRIHRQSGAGGIFQYTIEER